MFAYNPYLWDALINLDKKTEIKKIIERVFPESDNPDSINMINPRDILRIADYYYSKDKYEDAGRCYKKFLKLWHQADKDLPEYKRAYERLLEIETSFNR
jgi:tetratricopeptide (TPR) repeat protein